MKRKVLAATLREVAGAPLAGEQSLNSEKQHEIEMWTGLEPGFLTVYYQRKEVGVPLSNVKSLVWDKEDENRLGRNREA